METKKNLIIRGRASMVPSDVDLLKAIRGGLTSSKVHAIALLYPQCQVDLYFIHSAIRCRPTLSTVLSEVDLLH